MGAAVMRHRLRGRVATAVELLREGHHQAALAVLTYISDRAPTDVEIDSRFDAPEGDGRD